MKTYDKLVEGGIKLVLLTIGLLLLADAGIAICGDWKWINYWSFFTKLSLCLRMALGIIFAEAAFNKSSR